MGCTPSLPNQESEAAILRQEGPPPIEAASSVGSPTSSTETPTQTVTKIVQENEKTAQHLEPTTVSRAIGNNANKKESNATPSDVVLPFVGGYPSNHSRRNRSKRSSSSRSKSSTDSVHSDPSKGYPGTLFLDITIPNNNNNNKSPDYRTNRRTAASSSQGQSESSSAACTAGTVDSTFANTAARSVRGGATTITSNDIMGLQDDPICSFNSARIYGSVRRRNLEQLYDLVVIGGGPAGVAGAIRSAQMGRRTIVIDRPKPQSRHFETGIDIFFGAPTGLYSKALRDASKTISVKALRAQGLDDDVIWKQITNNILKLAERNAEGVIAILQKFGVDYQQGEARLLPESDMRAVKASQTLCPNDPTEYPFNQNDGCRSLVVQQAPVTEELEDGTEGVRENTSAIVSGTHILLCTGSKALHVQGIPFDGYRIFDSDSINSLSFLPKSIVIMGAGIIAIEFVQMFRKLTADVTMLIRGDLKSSATKLGFDSDVTDKLLELLVKSGVKIIEGATVDEFTSIPADLKEPLVFTLKGREEPLKADMFLAALGRAGNADDPVMGLEENDIGVSKKGHVDSLDQETLRTTSRQVYAAGDVAGSSLASAAKSQAVNAVESMFGQKNFTKEDNFGDDVSRGVWTLPEIGYYGATKKSAEARGIRVVEGISYYADCLRGRLFAPEGLLKIVANADTGAVLGIHMIGEDAAEMVHYGMGLVKNKTTIEDMMATTYTAVTYHELFKEAALDANFQLDFGVEWQHVFNSILATCELDPETGKPKNSVSNEELRDAFDKLNCRAGSHGLDIDDLRLLFAKIGRPVNKRVIVNLFRLSDNDCDGVINWEEFQAIWNKIHC